MGDTLGKLVRSKRKIDNTRVTNETKGSIINELNKYSEDYEFTKIPKTATVKEVNHLKKIVNERLAYDVTTLAINEGNTVLAPIYGKELQKSEDRDNQKIGQYAKPMAQAKKVSIKNLSPEEIEHFENGNLDIKGFGKDNIVNLVEKAKSKQAIEKIIKTIKTQDPKQIFYDNKLETFDRVFTRVGVTRADDIEKLKEHLKGLPMDKLNDHTNYLLQTLELYCNPTNIKAGAFKDEETELATARLDDMLIRTNINKTGIRKVKEIYKKYPKE